MASDTEAGLHDSFQLGRISIWRGSVAVTLLFCWGNRGSLIGVYWRDIGEILERYWDDDVTWCVSWLIGDGYCICLAGVQMTHPTVEVPLWSCCFWDWFQGHWDGLDMAVGFSFGINMVYPWSNCWAWLFHACFLQGICSVLLEGKTCGNLGTEVSTLWLEAWVGQCFCGTRPFQQLFFGNCLVFYFCPTFFCINTVCIASSAMTEVQQCCWHPALDGIHEVFLEKELAAG